MKPMVQNTSAKIASEREMVLPSPIMLGKESERALKLASFCKPWVRNIVPNISLEKNSNNENQKLL